VPVRVMLVAVVGLLGGLAGCERDPAEHICPDVADGGLVVTELRGDQDPNDTLGEWMEIYNASGVALDLSGLVIRLRSLDGSRDDRILIRTPVSIDADGYAVIAVGMASPGAYVDYVTGTDAGDTMPVTGAIDLDGCADLSMGDFADQLTYRTGLPSTGTYSLGVSPPTAIANDMPANWCTNPDPMGTPGEANPACPPP
jgi:hypothetical protein